MEACVSIPRRRGPALLMVLGSAALCLVCAALLFMDMTNYDFGIAPAFTGWFLKAVFLIGGVSGGGFCLVFLRRYLAGAPLLAADAAGVTDNSGLFAPGFLPWAEVEAIALTYVRAHCFLEISLRDPAAYLSRLSHWKRTAAQSNLDMGHQPICVKLSNAGVEPEDLLDGLQQLLDAARRQDR